MGKITLRNKLDILGAVKANNLTMTGLAKKSGKSRAALYAILNGEYTNKQIMEQLAGMIGKAPKEVWPDNFKNSS